MYARTCIHENLHLYMLIFLHTSAHIRLEEYSLSHPPLNTAGGVAEETFGSIRTVAALRAEKSLTDKFAGLVREAEAVCVYTITCMRICGRGGGCMHVGRDDISNTCVQGVYKSRFACL